MSLQGQLHSCAVVPQKINVTIRIFIPFLCNKSLESVFRRVTTVQVRRVLPRKASEDFHSFPLLLPLTV
ncbi:hypothetical protein Y032_0238g3302 [Ancylostoma ceylanicum]|nr:hypothetical protein Y032_0238g3302 [Ancylostoma ceylanicum]